jgi:YD repeat-containing protein
VTTPATPDHPKGLTTCYEYDRFREHPALIHNLTRVINPAGQTVVENRYGDDPGTDDFGRVVYQEFADFEATFHATRLQYVPRVLDAINVPALQVEVVDPGVLRVYTFNYRGNILDERFRLVQDGSYRLVARIYRYDEQGNQIEQREPNGLGLLYTYDHENPDPRVRGNLLRASLSAPLSRPAPGRDIAYEPRYQRIRTIQDEAGVIIGATTTFVYDYEETPVDHGDVIRIESPTVTLPDGSAQDIQERFTYNEFGQLITRQSGEGHLFSYEYYEDSPAVGYLKRTVIAPGVEDITQEFSYDLYGNVSAITQAADGLAKVSARCLFRKSLPSFFTGQACGE